jgi:hypothetical protein
MRNRWACIGRALVAAAALASPLAAQTAPPARLGSSFAVIGQPAPVAGEQAARANAPFLRIEVRPVSAVTLRGDVPAATASAFGAKADIPFVSGATLYGWPERPGLYCDLLRPRGLGLSAACLRDEDGDGAFDQGTRLDFLSSRANLLVISHTGKIIGANFTKVAVPLPAPVPYAATAPSLAVPGKLALRWKPGPKKGPPTIQLWLSTPDNYTGTEGLSENVLSVDRTRLPVEVELYGIRLSLLGFTPDGALRYSVLSVTDGAAVPLLFRGYVFRIIGY